MILASNFFLIASWPGRFRTTGGRVPGAESGVREAYVGKRSPHLNREGDGSDANLTGRPVQSLTKPQFAKQKHEISKSNVSTLWSV